ncbi:hypothetical protein D3C71_250040 [compost metagenome]
MAETQFQVEVRLVHLHAIGRDLDVLPESWSDALHELLPEGDNRSVHDDAVGARLVARRLIDSVGIPREDIRITQVTRSNISIDGDAEPEAGSLRLFRWSSEALRNYRPGHIFSLGRSADEARPAAVAAYREFLASDSWWGEAPDADGNFAWEDAREDYETALARFEEDLKAEPAAVGDAFLVQGSE